MLFSIANQRFAGMGSKPVAGGDPDHPVNGPEGGERAAGSAPADRQLPVIL